MRTKLISRSIVALTFFSILGCKTEEERALQAASHTDYVIGRIYRLKNPVFLFTSDRSDTKKIPILEKLGFSGTPLDLETFRQIAPTDHQVAGILIPGDQIKVIKLEESLYNPILGKFLYVRAVIVSGENTNQVVELSRISREGLTSPNLYVDPRYLEPL